MNAAETDPHSDSSRGRDSEFRRFSELPNPPESKDTLIADGWSAANRRARTKFFGTLAIVLALGAVVATWAILAGSQILSPQAGFDLAKLEAWATTILSAQGFYPAGIAATGVVVALIFNINSTLAKSEVDDEATQEELAQVAHWEGTLLGIAVVASISASAFALLVLILSPSTSAGPVILICALATLSCVLCAGITTRQQHPLERAKSKSLDEDYLRRTSSRHELVFSNPAIRTNSSKKRLVLTIVASSLMATAVCTAVALIASWSLYRSTILWAYVPVSFLIAILTSSLSAAMKLSRWTNLQSNPVKREKIGRSLWYITALIASTFLLVFARPASLGWGSALLLLPGFTSTGILGFAARKSRQNVTRNAFLIKIGAPIWSNIGQTLRRRYHSRYARA